MYDPSDQNRNPDGSPRDILGREVMMMMMMKMMKMMMMMMLMMLMMLMKVKYNCNEPACSNKKRKMGYKVKTKLESFLFQNVLSSGVRYSPGQRAQRQGEYSYEE